MVETQYRFREDEPVADPAVTVDSFGEQTNAAAVRIEPGDDARELLPFLDRLRLVEVNFPSFGPDRTFHVTGLAAAPPASGGTGCAACPATREKPAGTSRMSCCPGAG